jgi:hypothetical protein
MERKEMKHLIKKILKEVYYDSRKPLDGYVDAEDLVGQRLWFHTNRTHRNQGKNGMVGIYTTTKSGKRGSLTHQYTNEVRLSSPIYFQTSESGAKRIQKSREVGPDQRTLIAGVSGTVVPTRSGDTNGMVRIQYNPFDEAPWFYEIGDSNKKEIISGGEVYFNATEDGNWDIYLKEPVYGERSY